MGAHLKTTIEIADDVLVRAKRLAQSPARAPFRLKNPFRGEGLQRPDADWESIRDTIYRLG